MTAEEWARIKDIFEAALNLPEERRDEYLRAAAGDEPHIHELVVDLIRNHQSVAEASKRLNTNRAPALVPSELIAGRFRVLRFIAAGGMGEVYEVRDERLKVRVALKTLRSGLLGDFEAVERFRREIVIARSVSHDNLCRVFDFIEHHPATADGTTAPAIPCLTMELLEGESLAEMVRRARPLSVADARPLIGQIVDGLQILHDHGVIHRDLKPSNVMLVPRKSGRLRAVVMDFGLAKRQDAEGDLYESHTELQAGAPYFMAPELLQKRKPSVASDVYSLGLVIDELVTRTRAFSGSSLQEIYFGKLWENPTDPALRATGLPKHWGRTILRCLDSDPNARFSSAHDVLLALEGNTALTVSSPAGYRTKLMPTVRPTISRRAMIAGGVATPLLAGSAVIVWMAFEHVDTTVEVFNIDNLTNNQDYNYFCKGITNELMRSLLHLEGVRVMPVYATRGDSPSTRVGHFSLDGLLEAQGGKVRLSMRLTDNQDGRLVWSETYDREVVSNPLELESDIAQGAVIALDHHILSRGQTSSSRAILATIAMPLRRIFAVQSSTSLPGPPTYSNAAFDLYMRGHSLLEDLAPDSAERAAEYFLQAIQEDPNFALAYAAVSDARIASMNYDVAPRAETLASARSFAEEAVRRDSRLAEAHMVLGAVRQIDWDWPGAESSYREALRLKPNLARARRWYGGLILQFRRFDEAIAETRNSLDQDPYDRSGAPAFGLVLTLARRFSDAEAVLLQSLASKDMVLTRLNLAQLYAWLGHISTGTKAASYFANAITHVNAALALVARMPSERSQLAVTDAMLALYHTMMGDDPGAIPYLRKSEQAMAVAELSPVMVAKVYVARHDYTHATELLDRAAAGHDRRLLYVNINPFFENLRGQPGFDGLLSRMKLS